MGKGVRIGMLALLPLLGSAAAGAADKPADAAPVLEQITRLTQRYDMNRLEKYAIDFYFSSLHGLYAYRAMLQWAQQPTLPPQERADLVAMVNEGLLAVFRDSGAGVALAGAMPGHASISIAYGRALPRYAEDPDPARPQTLAWSDRDRQHEVSAASVGQSLAAKALWLELVEAKGETAAFMLATLRQEFDLLASQLFLAVADGGSAYVPEALTYGDDGQWQVKDKRSRLMSQASLLLGLTRLDTLLRKEAVMARYGIRGDDLVQWQRRVRVTLDKVYEGMVRRHYNEIAGSFVDTYDPQRGGQGDRIMLEDMAQLSAALDAMRRSLPEAEPLRLSAQRHLTVQAAFLLAGLQTAQPVPRGYLLNNHVPMRSAIRTLTEPLAAMSVLLTAAAAGDEAAGQAATAIREEMRESLWVDELGIYRSAAGYTVSAYDGYLFSLVLGWLQQLQRVDAEGALHQLQAMLRVVLKQGGLLQCEGPLAGETITLAEALRDKAPAAAQEIAALDEEERGKPIAAFVRGVVDQDGDTVPGCAFAGGEHGAAPVVIIQTSVKTPFPVREEGEKAAPALRRLGN